MPRILRSIVPAVGALAIAAGFAHGPVHAQARQGGAPPAPPTNLQVLPKDVPRADLLATMRAFEQALGVDCAYCHVREGRGGRNDLASDEKAPKLTARVMMHLVDHVNEMLVDDLGKPAASVVKVECATCHRGSAIPKVEPPAPVAAR